MSTAERLMKEGEARGELRGVARRLCRLLEKRFGPLPAEIAERVGGAGIVDLDRWFDRVLDAATLDDLFA